LQARLRAQEHLARSYEQLKLNLGRSHMDPIVLQRLRVLGQQLPEAYE
jgi:hypothetical protein